MVNLISLELLLMVLNLAFRFLDDALIVENALFEVLALVLEGVALIDQVGKEFLPVSSLLGLDEFILGFGLNDLDTKVGE